jgi:hypothetical protein
MTRVTETKTWLAHLSVTTDKTYGGAIAFTHAGTAYMVVFHTLLPLFSVLHTPHLVRNRRLNLSLLLPLYPFLALEALHHESGNAFFCIMIIVSLGWCGVVARKEM